MKLIDPSFEMLTNECTLAMLQRIEQAGRVCYQSQPIGDPCSFVRMLIKTGHYSVLEHVSISVRLVVDRGVSHELVRHRLASYSMESQRYCDYNKDDMEFIKPSWYDEMPENVASRWREMLMDVEANYKELRRQGMSPQKARSVLPNSLKTEIFMTANVREWRHIFQLRTSPAAHPDISYIMGQVLTEFRRRYPVLFEEVGG